MVTTIFEEDSLAPRLRKATTGQAGKKNIATEALKHRRENANCIFCASVPLWQIKIPAGDKKITVHQLPG